MYGHQRGKAARGGGCGVMNWEIGVDMYRPMCIKWMTNKKKKKKKKNIYIYIYIYKKKNNSTQATELIQITNNEGEILLKVGSKQQF